MRALRHSTRADALLTLAQRAGLAVRRLSRAPHRAATSSFTSLLPDRRQPARDFFEAVHALAERALA